MITKNKAISLIILIFAFIWLSVIVLITEDQSILHVYELFAVIAGLLFYLPGAFIAATVTMILIITILPINLEIIVDFFELYILGGIAGWFASREHKVQKRLSALLREDRLTGLHNFSYFNDRIQEEKKRADRSGSDLSLIMIDIDLFKPFNDIYGHRMGNLFLKRLSEIFLREVRAIDIVCRYGGEEFAVILPNTSSEADEIAERLRKAVSLNDFRISDNETVNKTISAGIAVYPRDASDEVDLLDRADAALYEAKKRGRNQTVNYKELAEGNPVSIDK